MPLLCFLLLLLLLRPSPHTCFNHSVLNVWLAFFNGVGVVFFLGLCIFWALKEDNWPMTKKKVQKLTKGFEHFLKAIVRATKLLEKVRTQLPMFVRTDRLKGMIGEIQNSVKQVGPSLPLSLFPAVLLLEPINQSTNRPIRRPASRGTRWSAR